MRLEVNHHNESTRRLYLAIGYVEDTRGLLTLQLAGRLRDARA